MSASRTTLMLLMAAALAACQHDVSDPFETLVTTNSPDRKLVVTPDHLALAPGATAQLTAQVFTNEGEPTPNARVTFATADASIATVNGSGLVTGIKVGTTTVTVSSKGAADVAVPVAVVTMTHPAGTIATTLHTTSRLFGAAVSRSGVTFLTQPDPQLLQRIDLPTEAFSGTVGVGQQATDVTFDTAGAFAFVTNQFDQNVGVVTTSSNTETATISVPFDPFRVLGAFDGHTAFVSGNQPLVAIVDRSSGTTIATIPLPGLSNGLALNSTGTKLYASLLFNGVVEEIDVATRTILRSFTISGAGTLQAVAVSRDDAELYVADEGAGQLWIINVASGSVSGSVALGGGAFEAKVSPDNAQVYVALSGSGVVQVIDRAARSVVATISTGGVPRRLAFNASGTTAVVANEAGWVDIIH